MGDPLPQREHRQGRQQRTATLRVGYESESEKAEQSTGNDQPTLAKALRQPPDEPTLDDSAENPGVDEEPGDGRHGVAEAQLGELSEGGLEVGEGEDGEEDHHQAETDQRIGQGFGQAPQIERAAASLRFSLRVEGLGQPRQDEQEGDQRGRRRSDPRQPRRHRHQEGTDRRSEDETEAESGADQPHALGPVLGTGDIGDDRLRGRDVAARYTVDDARGEEHPQRAGDSEEHVAQRRAEERDQQHRPPPEPVRQTSEDRREDELHDRERGHQETECHRGRPVLLGIEWQDRDDDAKAHQIDKDDQEDDADLRAVLFQAIPSRVATRGILQAPTSGAVEPGVETRRHKDTKTSQRPPTGPYSPQITQINTDALTQDSITWRGPGRRTAAKDRWNEPQFRSRAIVTGARSSGLRSLSAGLATSHLYLMVGRGTPPFQIGGRRGGTDAPLARRPVGSLAATNACVRSSRASYRWAAIARSPAVPPSILGTAHHISEEPFVPSCLRVCDVGPASPPGSYAVASGRLCASASLRLCVLFSVSELCVSVSLWFFGRRLVGTA